MSKTLRLTRPSFGSLRYRRNPLRKLYEEPRLAARVVCVASGKGGTGKSVVATNLASSRARSGERVCLIDFDVGLANDHLLLGLSPRHDLGHVMRGEVSAHQALVPGPNGLNLLSGGVGRHILTTPTRRQLDRLFRGLASLEDDHDLIVVDLGAGLGYVTVAHLAATTTMMLVTNPEVTALSDAYALYKRARGVNPHIRAGLVLNRCRDQARAQSAWERFSSASRRFLGASPELIGWVPSDDRIGESVEERAPLLMGDCDGPGARALKEVVRWEALEHARSARPFFERARRALR